MRFFVARTDQLPGPVEPIFAANDKRSPLGADCSSTAELSFPGWANLCVWGGMAPVQRRDGSSGPASGRRPAACDCGGQLAGVVNALYKVHDRFEAVFDAHTFCSQRVFKNTQEGSHSRQSELHFDYGRHKSVFDEKNLKTGESKHVENDIPGCGTDVVSGFYYLASLPLQPGNTNTFAINDGGKTAEVTARVEAREQVKVPAGTFQTVRVKAEAVSGSMQGKGTVWCWFTDDPNHTPVQMRSKLGWGTLLFRLQRIEKQ